MAKRFATQSEANNFFQWPHVYEEDDDLPAPKKVRIHGKMYVATFTKIEMPLPNIDTIIIKDSDDEEEYFSPHTPNESPPSSPERPGCPLRNLDSPLSVGDYDDDKYKDISSDSGEEDSDVELARLVPPLPAMPYEPGMMMPTPQPPKPSTALHHFPAVSSDSEEGDDEMEVPHTPPPVVFPETPPPTPMKSVKKTFKPIRYQVARDPRYKNIMNKIKKNF